MQQVPWTHHCLVIRTGAESRSAHQHAWCEAKERDILQGVLEPTQKRPSTGFRAAPLP